MAEFGHFGAISPGCCIDVWGAGPFKITVADKTYSFEDSDRFGPYLLNRRGDPLSKQPGERHPFWRGYNAWLAQGRQVENGTCVWREPKPTTVMRLSGRQAIMIEQGEDGGKTIVLPFDPKRFPRGGNAEGK